MLGPRVETTYATTIDVPEVAILDFDRMLGDVDASNRRLYASARRLGVDVTDIESLRMQIEADGGSFGGLDDIAGALSYPYDLKDLVAEFRKQSTDDAEVMYPDAQPFLKRLREGCVPYTVVTWGVSWLWQYLKIASSGYIGGVTIVPSANKGQFITSLQQEDRYYFQQHAPVGAIYRTKRVNLLDDKAKAFEGLPKGCAGFCVQRDDPPLRSQAGEVPGHVQRVRSLDELVVTDGYIVQASQEHLKTRQAQRIGEYAVQASISTFLPMISDDRIKEAPHPIQVMVY